MKFFVAGLSYKTAPVAVRERLAVSASRMRCHGCRLRVAGELAEVAIVSTCNRVEVYGVASRVNGNVHGLFRHLARGEQFDFAPHLYVKEDGEALRHLFSVAGGLDSMVLGETEITGQLKQAYQAAAAAKLTGPVLNRAFQTAFSVAKTIRTQTLIGRGATSVGSVAVELAEKLFGNTFAERTIMIVGAGKMGEACIRHLAKKGARTTLVVNRSVEKAEQLAAEFGGRAVRFSRLFEAMVQADIVVSSTGAPQAILNGREVAAVMATRRNRPLFLIDIAVPRDIAPEVQQLENVYLYNIDHLESLVRENVKLREQELARCSGILDEQVAEVLERIHRGRAAERRAAVGPTTEWMPGLAPCAG